jgi:hypothetical protein
LPITKVDVDFGREGLLVSLGVIAFKAYAGGLQRFEDPADCRREQRHQIHIDLTCESARNFDPFRRAEG